MNGRIFGRSIVLAMAISFGGCANVWGDQDDPTDDDSTGDDDTGGDDDTLIDDDTSGDDDTGDDDTSADDDTGDDDAAPPPSGYMYAHTDDELIEVMPTAPYTLTLLGPFVGTLPEWGFTDFALDINGTMYASSFDAIYHVDPTTLQVTEIASLAGGALNALTALADGTLLAGSQNVIYLVDPLNGSVTNYGTIPGWYFAGDMVGSRRKLLSFFSPEWDADRTPTPARRV